MSKANPKKAIAALIPPAQAVLRPMTLAMFAALERIESPLITGAEPRDVLELIPSLYLLTHDPMDVFRENIIEAAMRWADEQPVSVVEEIKEAAYRQINAFFDVIPQSSKPKKASRPAMDGSRSTSTGRPRPTTGHSKRSSAASPSRRSRSSAGNHARTRTAHSTSSH